MHVAVVGGGVGGLATAYYLRKIAKVTVFEQSSRLGGWIWSDRIDKSGTNLVLERGPRTIRPAGFQGALVLKMALELGLENEIIWSPTRSARWILIDDKLNKNLMGSLARMLPRMALDLTMPPQDLDVSVYDFIRTRFGHDFATRIFSAVVHGIHAADSRKINMKYAFPLLYDAAKHTGSVFLGLRGAIARRDARIAEMDPFFVEKWRKMAKKHYFSFKNGLQTLIDALVYELEHPLDCERVKIQLNTRIEPNFFNLKNFDYIVEACDVNKFPGQDVSVVNVVYAPNTVARQNAFGFLASECRGSRTDVDLLGVVFDSDAVESPDSLAGWTKYTVMFRGKTPAMEQRALRVLERHLLVSKEPDLVVGHAMQSCIPAYSREWAMRSPAGILVGTWHCNGGVGLCDSIKGGFEASERIKSLKQPRE